MVYYIGDCETDNLLDEVTKFHCIGFSPRDNNKFFIFCDMEELSNFDQDQFKSDSVDPVFFPMDDYIKLLNSPKTTGICMHNILGYDLPVFKKLSGVEYDWKSINGRELIIEDSLVLSQYLYPDRPIPKGCKGAHGLQAWGVRTGVSKPKVDDWSDQPLNVYIHRLIEDIRINKAAYEILMKEKADVAIPNGTKKGQWDIPLRMAHKTRYLMQQQEETGVRFDIQGAKKLIIRIDKEMKEIEAEVEPILGDRVLPESQQPNFPSNCFKKAFDYTAPFTQKGLKKQVSDYLNVIDVPEKMHKDFICSMMEREVIDGVDIIHNYIEDELPKHHSLLTQSAINYCNKFGIVDDQGMFEEICRVLNKGPERKLTAQMTLSNQDDIKQFFINKFKWEPSIWRSKSLSIDPSTKKEYPKKKIEENIQRYIKDIQKSPYKKMLLKELGYKKEPDFSSDSFYKKIKRKARFVPSSPQLKDIGGKLCPNLEKIDAVLAKKIIHWLSLRNRRTTIKSFDKDTGWLNHKRLEKDKRLPGAASGITNTFRMRHSVICNIPKASPKVVLGREMRDLFIHPKGYCCIGSDCSGIEGRAMAEAAWNFDGGEYAEEILNGDIHIKNSIAFSKVLNKEITRGESKSPYYGGLYGCQAPKMAAMFGVERDLGQQILDALWSVSSGPKKCKDALEEYWESTGRKYIMSISGAKIFTRSKHSLLNAYVQNMDSTLMDWACCWIDMKIKEEELDAQRWIYYHDEVGFYNNIKELQVEYFNIDQKPDQKRDGKIYSKTKLFRDGKILHYGLNKDEDPLSTDQWIQWYSRVGEICVQGMINAGKAYNFRVPIDGEYIIGGSWGQVH